MTVRIVAGRKERRWVVESGDGWTLPLLVVMGWRFFMVRERLVWFSSSS